MDRVQERINAWLTAGLIDAATAERLRQSESEQVAEAPAATTVSVAESSAPRRGPSSLASIFGPGVTIGEMFAYLGGAFLLGAYEAFVVRLAGNGGRADLTIALGAGVAAIAIALVGMVLRSGDARRRRAAGVMFALAVAHAAAAASGLASVAQLSWPVVGVAGAAVATAVAVGLRRVHRAVLTQFALLASVTSFAGLVLSWFESVVVPEPLYTDSGVQFAQTGPAPVILIVVAGAWWLAIAVAVGLLGLFEARTADVDPAASRRASVTRLWAGLVAVIGLATSVTRSGYTSYPGTGSDGYSYGGEYGRILEPGIGDLAILVLAAVLVERAFRRDASTFVYAAALALMIALSDFNFSYLSSTTELGLLLEGIILLGAGVAADRLRRRIGRPGSTVAPDPQPA